MSNIYESVPNVSCGKNLSIVNSLVATLRKVQGLNLINVDTGFDADRTVFTMLGDPDVLFHANLALYEASMKLIDMRNYTGNHPAIGALDVCPFIPISPHASIEICKELSIKLAIAVSSKFGIPVFLYGDSARVSKHRELSYIRSGGLIGLQNRFLTKERQPDYGQAFLHETFGATSIGARNILIAFNVSLDSTDVSIAKWIASEIRESSN